MGLWNDYWSISIPDFGIIGIHPGTDIVSVPLGTPHFCHHSIFGQSNSGLPLSVYLPRRLIRVYPTCVKIPGDWQDTVGQLTQGLTYHPYKPDFHGL